MNRRLGGVGRTIALLAAMLAGGCSSVGSMFGSGSSQPASSSNSNGSDALSDRLGNLFAGPAPKVMATTPQGGPDFDCPTIGIREGASTLSVNTPNADATPMNLRYQATIARTARECAVLGATLTMKVGVQGRVILGPNGGPGQLDVPIRYALVQEGPESKTLISKLDRVTVQIPPNQTNIPFTHVQEDMTIPMPSAGDLDQMVLYVGFDPTGAAEEEKQKHKPAARPKAKAKTAAQGMQVQ